MHQRPSCLLSLGFLSAASGIFAGCGAPLSAGHSAFFGPVDDAHSYVRAQQSTEDHGRFIGLAETEERLAARLNGADCYRIVSASTQWGIYEPEMVFEGESVQRPGERAYVFVPPLLDGQTVFPTPKETFHVSVFRVDQDSPMGPKIIDQLEHIAAHRERCVRFARVSQPRRFAQDYTVIAAQVLLADAAPKLNAVVAPAPASASPPAKK